MCGCGGGLQNNRRYERNPTTNTYTVVPDELGESQLIMNQVSDGLARPSPLTRPSPQQSPRPQQESLSERVRYWTTSRGQVSPPRQRSSLFRYAPSQYDGREFQSFQPFHSFLSESPSRLQSPPGPGSPTGQSGASLARRLGRAIVNNDIYFFDDLMRQNPSPDDLNYALRVAAQQRLSAVNPVVVALLQAGASPEAARISARESYEGTTRILQNYSTLVRRYVQRQ
jgi:hypothetical protein